MAQPKKGSYRDRTAQVEREVRWEAAAPPPRQSASALDEVLDNMASKFLRLAGREGIVLGKNEAWLRKAFRDVVAGSGMLEHRRPDGTSKWRDGNGKTRQPYEVGNAVVAYFYREIVPGLSSVAEMVPTFTDAVLFKQMLISLDRRWSQQRFARQPREDKQVDWGERWRESARHNNDNGGQVA